MLKENDVATNNVGDGKIAGLGIGNQGEPPYTKKKSLINSLIKRAKAK